MATLTKALKEAWIEDAKQELTGYDEDKEIMFFNKIAHLHIVKIPEAEKLEGTNEDYIVTINMMQQKFYYNHEEQSLYLDYYDHEAGEKALNALEEEIKDMEEAEAKEAIRGRYIQHIKRKEVFMAVEWGEGVGFQVSDLIEKKL